MLSILVPVYRTAPYIARCAESLFTQTHPDIEYIFVDDATPDDAISILLTTLDRYPSRRPHVRILRHPANLGTEQSRITALRAATGTHILYIDSDDYIDPDMVATMYRRAIDTDADIVTCDLLCHYADGTTHHIREYVNPDPALYLRDMIINDRTNGYMANKLYRATLFRHLTYPLPRINYCEDWYANIQLYHAARHITHIPRPMYHYIQYNTTSVSRRKTAAHYTDKIRFWHRVDHLLHLWHLTDQYTHLLPVLKLSTKADLILATPDPALRLSHRHLYDHLATPAALRRLRPGQRLALWLLSHGMNFAIDPLRHILILKGRLTRKS